jgi:hypothetical protein
MEASRLRTLQEMCEYSLLIVERINEGYKSRLKKPTEFQLLNIVRAQVGA